MGRRSSRPQRSVGQVFCEARMPAQGTLEYAVVLAGFLALVVGLGTLRHVVSGDMLVGHALSAASHHLEAASLGWVGDVFLY